MNGGQKGFSSPERPPIEITYSYATWEYVRLTRESARIQLAEGTANYVFILPDNTTMEEGDCFTFIKGNLINNMYVDYFGIAGIGYVYTIFSIMPLFLTCRSNTRNNANGWIASSNIPSSMVSTLYTSQTFRGVLKCDAAGNILSSDGISSITDVGTGRLTVTFTYSFGTTDYSVLVSVEAISTSYAVVSDRKARIVFGGQAAGAVDLVCTDSTVTNNLVKDPTAWHVEARIR